MSRKIALLHLQRAFELDATLRPKETASMADSALAVDSRATITKYIREAVLNMSRYPYATSRRRHALDEADEHKDLALNIARAHDHMQNVRAGDRELDKERVRSYLDAAYDCLGGKGKGEDELEEPVKEVGRRAGARDSALALDRNPELLDVKKLFDVGGSR